MSVCSLSAWWEPGSQEAWFLISDESAGKRQVRRYGWRMREEATFQDSKSRGWQIEASCFGYREHLARWLLVVFVAIWWTAHLGSSCVHHGHRRLLDRADRRDKSLLRLGRLWLLRILKRGATRSAPSGLLAGGSFGQWFVLSPGRRRIVLRHVLALTFVACLNTFSVGERGVPGGAVARGTA